MEKKVTQGVKPFKTRRYASLGGRDDLQMAGSFSRKIRIWSEIRASCQCNVRTFFLKVFATFCDIQRNQRVGRFADRTGAESKSFGFVEVDCAVSCFHDVSGKMSRYEKSRS